ncbi:Type II transport protein GspH [compost metagenome]
MVARQRVKTAAADLHTSLLQARAEAIKRNQRVLIRPGSGETWSNGWLVPDTSTPDADTNPLFRHRIASGVKITSAAQKIEFRPNGRVSAGATLKVESSVDSSKTRCVEIGLDGRARSGACGG